jgi:hypothetical protein
MPIPEVLPRADGLRLASLARRYGRQTHGLRRARELVGLALGGPPGARLSQPLGLGSSRHTLLRLVRALPDRELPEPRVLGVDDWAPRKGAPTGPSCSTSSATGPSTSRLTAPPRAWRPGLLCRGSLSNGRSFARCGWPGTPCALPACGRLPGAAAAATTADAADALRGLPAGALGGRLYPCQRPLARAPRAGSRVAAPLSGPMSLAGATAMVELLRHARRSGTPLARPAGSSPVLTPVSTSTSERTRSP